MSWFLDITLLLVCRVDVSVQLLYGRGYRVIVFTYLEKALVKIYYGSQFVKQYSQASKYGHTERRFDLKFDLEIMPTTAFDKVI